MRSSEIVEGVIDCLEPAHRHPTERDAVYFMQMIGAFVERSPLYCQVREEKGLTTSRNSCAQ
jgi:hypothetical protein